MKLKNTNSSDKNQVKTLVLVSQLVINIAKHIISRLSWLHKNFARGDNALIN